MAGYKPEGYQSVIPYLVVRNARALIAFLQSAFDAELLEKIEQDGAVRHAEVRIADSVMMIGESSASWPAVSSQFYLYVPDADATYRRAIAAGAESIMEPRDQFYGDRSGAVRDLEGNQWWISTNLVQLSKEESTERMASPK